MDFSIRPAGLKELGIVSDILNASWRPAYGTILSEEQTRFMLSTLFSREKMKQQILEENHCFMLACLHGEAIGFAAYQHNFNRRECCKLHKLYLLPEMQGLGFGKLLLLELMQQARAKNQKSLFLNVNRQNPAKQFYEKLGFTIAEQVDIPIGNGYYMNDFVMELKL